MTYILLFAVVPLLGAKVINVAPGDIQSQCTRTILPTDPGHGLHGRCLHDYAETANGFVLVQSIDRIKRSMRLHTGKC